MKPAHFAIIALCAYIYFCTERSNPEPERKVRQYETRNTNYASPAEANGNASAGYVKTEAPKAELVAVESAEPKITNASQMIEFRQASKDDKEVALHEAGHFLAATLTGCDVAEASIIEKKGLLGYVVSGGNAIVSASGYAAEDLYCKPEFNVYRRLKSGRDVYLTNGSDLYELVESNPSQAVVEIEKARLLLASNKEKLFKIAACLYHYKSLNEKGCKMLTGEILERK